MTGPQRVWTAGEAADHPSERPRTPGTALAVPLNAMQYDASPDYSFSNVDDTEVMPASDDVFVTEPEIPTLDPDPGKPTAGPLKRPPPPAFMRRRRSYY